MKHKLKGSGEFIGWTVAVTGLTSFVILLVGLFFLCRGVSQMENAVDTISRDIVVCDSLSDARTLAQEKAEKQMADFDSVIKAGTVKAEVVYSPGSRQEWKKGNYVTVILSADMDCRVPVISGVRETSAMVMIERDGKKDE